MKAYKLLIVALLSSLCCSAQMYLDTPSLVQAMKVENIRPGLHMHVMGNKLIFVSGKIDGTTGSKWYSYDGINTITSSPELNPGPGDDTKTQYIFPKKMFAELNDTIYFAGQNTTVGSEVFKWDGSNTPVLIKNIMPGAGNANPAGFVTTDNKVYFVADTSSSGKQNIYEYNPGTNIVTTIKQQANFDCQIAVHNKKLYLHKGAFNIIEEYNPITKQFKTITTLQKIYTHFISYGSKLYFISGKDLYCYDGTTTNIIPGASDIQILVNGLAAYDLHQKQIIAAKGKLYFWQVVNNVKNMYCYDTSTGQVNLAPGLKPFWGGFSFFLIEHQNKLYYNDGDMLVRYDGTKADTMLPFNFDPITMIAFNSELYMSGRGYGIDTYMLYKFKDTLVPGTPPSTVQAVAFNADITLYPNPAGSSATISIDLPVANTITTVVTDITGKIVYKTAPVLYSTGKSEIPLPLHNLSPGSYIVSLKDSSGNILWSGKLVHQ